MNKKMTPLRFLKDNVYETLPAHKKRRAKVTSENFIIPEYGEHEKLIEINFNVRQLREMARFYKQKRSGNKPQLLFILYNFLRFSKFAIIIQKYARGYLRRHYNTLKGPAFLKRYMCINDTDFITLEKISTIPHQQLCTMKDKDGYIFGFDICSLYNLLFNKKYQSLNPYTRKPFPKKFNENIKKIIKLSSLYAETINIVFADSYKGLSQEKQVGLLGISVFQKIDNLGNHSNSQWLLSLNRSQLFKFIRELMDIWVFRANIPPHLKRKICPPVGNPFIGFNSTIYTNFPLYKLKRKILMVIESFVTNGVDRDSKVLGALYVLTALTLVSKDAAEARPELYDSALPH